MENKNNKFIETYNVTRSFRLVDEPEMIHIIKTGFDDLYMVVHEDAYQMNLGEVDLLNEKQIKEKFNIVL